MQTPTAPIPHPRPLPTTFEAFWRANTCNGVPLVAAAAWQTYRMLRQREREQEVTHGNE